MSGRPRKQVFEYDRMGKFIRKFSCINDVRKEYFSQDVGRRPLFRNGSYEIINSERVLFLSRVGRKIATHTMVINENPLRISSKDNNPIEMYNVENIKIAEFKSIGIASKLLGLSYKSIYGILKHGDSKIKSNLLRVNFRFKQNGLD